MTAKTKPLLIVIAWLLLSASLAISGILIGQVTEIPGPTSLTSLLSNPGEKAAITAGLPPKDDLLLILHNQSLKTFDPAFKAARASLVSALKEVKQITGSKSALTLVQSQETTSSDPERFISKDSHSSLITAVSRAPIYDAKDDLLRVKAIADEWSSKHPGFEVRYLSNSLANEEMFEVINSDLDTSLFTTLPITFLILLWTFRTLVASLVPLVVAGVSLAASLGCAAVVSHLGGAISATASQLVVLIVLAIGIDYSLFLITRVRELRSGGVDINESIRLASQTTGKAIWWSGVIVAVSLAGLYLMNDSILFSMATVTLLSVFYTMGSATYALPSLLAIIGNNLEWGALRQNGRSAQRENHWVALALKYPRMVLIGSVSILALLSAFAARMELGTTVEPLTLPKRTQTYKAAQHLKNHFSEAFGSVVHLLAHSQTTLVDKEEMGELQPLVDVMADQNGIAGPFLTQQSSDGCVFRYSFLAQGRVNDKSNQELLGNFTTALNEPGITPEGVSVSLSGIIPQVDSEIKLYQFHTPVVISAVITTSFILLLIAFRSIVVPIKAMILNLLSTSSAFGILVLVFQGTWQSSDSPNCIQSFVPPLLFTILFGLSMDYHVFLLARIREEFDRTNDIVAAVSTAANVTFGNITSAAAIMVSVFLVIATLEMPMMRQLGVGLAAAVFIDATIIRCLLLPASMVLLGKWNWYCPGLFRK
jgi:putative drug exporter of the RND superfamily